MEVEMKIRGLMMDPVTNMPIVVLKDVGGSSILPIWVGIYEANAIALEIEKVSTPRPMTHDLIKTLLLGLGTGVHVEHASIEEQALKATLAATAADRAMGERARALAPGFRTRMGGSFEEDTAAALERLLS